MHGRYVLRSSAVAIKTNEGKTAENILSLVWKEEPAKSAGTQQNEEADGCGSANGAASRCSTNKSHKEAQYFIIASK